MQIIIIIIIIIIIANGKQLEPSSLFTKVKVIFLLAVYIYTKRKNNKKYEHAERAGS